MVFSKLSIRARLLVVNAISSALFIIAIYYVLLGMDAVNQQFTNFINHDQKRLEMLRTMQAEGSQAVIAAAK
ncbi:MAG: hypothetical protein P8179_02690, partial [Candidatus Thiodiazotropha sp.]